ncbi:replication factor-a protein 1 (rpa1) [Edhazardia aedis USNM 41457]|uniref:Replication protein A subunit n=1 Tax=Edhazardia aedis (strain USNM 41457) TaxID=1003232 RepID=J9DBY1_EDHAE|nr:replication factor-a protein 1 (rpa1) [Edhazardia aedis USNM 41457]|eukprot:EJW05236.1 replication factor-a protein 1 (rpa1) [Edhazardia aedis USNM 41457]
MQPVKGTIEALCYNQRDNPLYFMPTVQVFNIEQHKTPGYESVRMKCFISDSVNYMKAIFSTKFTNHFLDGNIKNYSIIKIASFEIREKKPSLFMYITDLENFWDHDGLIGSPAKFGDPKLIDRLSKEKLVNNRNINAESKGNNKYNNGELSNSPHSISFSKNTKVDNEIYDQDGANDNDFNEYKFQQNSKKISYNNENHNKNNEPHYKSNPRNDFYGKEERESKIFRANDTFENTNKNTFESTNSNAEVKQKFSKRGTDNLYQSKNNKKFTEETFEEKYRNFEEHDDLHDPDITTINIDRNNYSCTANKINFDKANSNYSNKDSVYNQQKSVANIGNFQKNNLTEENKKHVENTPIASINPFQNKWSIKGRCTYKSDIKKFTNARGEGKLFTVNISDETGTIKISAFSECVDMFFTIFENGKSFIITKGQVKMANKKYSTGTSDYEIYLDKNSEVTPIFDEGAPRYFFNFVKINDLNISLHQADVIGVVKEAYPTSTITLRNTGKEQKKRDFVIIDETGNIRLTLWGSGADLPLEVGDVIACNCLSIREYNGIVLSQISPTQVHINPDLEECFLLKGWYENEGKNIKVHKKASEQRYLISDIIENEMKWGSFIGTVLQINENSLYYQACIECKKKVIDEGEDVYRCEKCNKTFDQCIPKYTINLQIADFTSSIRAMVFDAQGDIFFGISAKHLVDLGQKSSQIDLIIKNSYLRDFIFKTSMRQESYQGETRNKYNVSSLEECNYISESKILLDEIRKSL